MIRCELPGGGRVLFTARASGNLSTMRGAGHELGAAARDRMRAELGLRRLCAGAQVHGSTVRRDLPGDRPGDDLLPVQADGQATSSGRVGVMVLTADCLPVVIASRAAVAAVHAGWRGLAAGVLEEGVRAVRELGAASASTSHEAPAPPEPGSAEEIVAIIGPGAGPCCYVVGVEVHAALGSPVQAGPAAPDGGAAAPIDLKAIACERLLEAGASSVRDLGLCTICDERFYSHRREAQHAGRQAGIAWLS
ncbi:MAG TPA: polyphenol oxidase family protein [Solirubrobacteraceae bacterium]|nr:polyphenol oxidase family protein [Solirubrobacteraceae bacterium]